MCYRFYGLARLILRRMLLIKHIILTLLMSKRWGGEVCGDIDLQARSSCPRSLLSQPLLPPVRIEDANAPNLTTVSKASYQPQDHRVLGNTAPSGGFLYHSFLLSLPCKIALQTFFFVLQMWKDKGNVPHFQLWQFGGYFFKTSIF